MFYRPENRPDSLPHDPFKAIVSPRPIGWISTLAPDGTANLAPYSFFNAVADNPPMVMFSSTGTKDDQTANKDSVANIRATEEFVVNIVSFALKDAMNATSAPLPARTDEFAHAGLQKAPCVEVAPPRVARTPAALECRMVEILDLPGKDNTMVIGQVVGVHLDENVLVNGVFDVTRYKPLARMGYRDYAVVTDVFPLSRPE